MSRAWIDRLRRLDPQRRDLVVGAVLGVEMQVEALRIDVHRPAVHALLLLLAGCLALRRRYPLATFVVAMVPFVAVQALGREVTDNVFVGLFVCVFLAYSVAANSGSRWWWIAAPIAFGSGLLAIGLDDYAGTVAGDFLWLGLIFVAAPMVTGRLIRNRSQLQRALHDKARRLEREREQAAEQAVVDERTRIAGDLHDIVAHALTEMTLQATAARRLAARDPERARAAFEAVEERGRDALGELRRLLGVLRHSDEEIALAPQPSLRHLDALARRASAAGLPVDVAVEGDVADLPAGVDVTGYRVVQEALSAALRARGAGRAEVRVRYGASGVELEVRDDGRLVDAGPPLGLRERVALYGGELSAASRRDGGHVVRARLPREVPA
ncbi:MAG TPA: histidine kinase [Solirubrobacteraceae bacterium]|nr:histidine kinase [Solirubrobacteraceae bacterium]